MAVLQGLALIALVSGGVLSVTKGIMKLVADNSSHQDRHWQPATGDVVKVYTETRRTVQVGNLPVVYAKQKIVYSVGGMSFSKTVFAPESGTVDIYYMAANPHCALTVEEYRKRHKKG